MCLPTKGNYQFTQKLTTHFLHNLHWLDAPENGTTVHAPACSSTTDTSIITPLVDYLQACHHPEAAKPALTQAQRASQNWALFGTPSVVAKVHNPWGHEHQGSRQGFLHSQQNTCNTRYWWHSCHKLPFLHDATSYTVCARCDSTGALRLSLRPTVNSPKSNPVFIFHIYSYGVENFRTIHGESASVNRRAPLAVLLVDPQRSSDFLVQSQV